MSDQLPKVNLEVPMPKCKPPKQAQRCYTCKHWKGDRAKVLGLIEGSPTKEASPLDGWGPGGACNEVLVSIELFIASGRDGYQLESLETDAGFGCILWEKLDDDE